MDGAGEGGEENCGEYIAEVAKEDDEGVADVRDTDERPPWMKKNLSWMRKNPLDENEWFY